MRLPLVIFIRSVICLAVSVMFLCTDPPVSQGGGGSEVEVVGCVLSDDSTPSSQAQIKLIPQGYDAFADGSIGDSLIDTTDTRGLYLFKKVLPGKYNVQAVQLKNRTRMLITNVDVKGDTTRVQDGLLKRPGTMRLVPGTKMKAGHVSIPGTDIAVTMRENSTEIIIDSIPCGELPGIKVFVSSSDVQILTDVVIVSGDTTTIVNPRWTGHKQIVLNTTASGADVKEKVFAFPVLVRLNSRNFDFSQALGSGDDIRFTSSNGKPLLHEIEMWDSLKQQAAIWVKVDTIYGDDNQQTIDMHWGNVQAEIVSNSTKVFDTATGFQGVWHLASTSENKIPDATINNFIGLSPDTARPKGTDGVIGYCQSFDGINDFITVPNTAASVLNFPENGNFTVSAWVKTDTLDGVAQLIVAKGYDQYFLRLTYFPTGAPLWEFTEFRNDDSWQPCTTAARSAGWMHLTGVRSGTRQVLYINGIPVDSTPDSYKGNNLKRGTASDITIGKLLEKIDLPNETQGYCYFKGLIDEVRIDNRARSAAWVKLSFMNQQPNDKLVEFK
jgi:hypothetical protein